MQEGFEVAPGQYVNLEGRDIFGPALIWPGAVGPTTENMVESCTRVVTGRGEISDPTATKRLAGMVNDAGAEPVADATAPWVASAPPKGTRNPPS